MKPDWSGKKPLRAPDCTIDQNGDEYDCRGPDINLQFNESVYIVWQLCDGTLTVEEIIRLIQDAYPTQAQQIEEDVFAALELLTDAGALSGL